MDPDSMPQNTGPQMTLDEIKHYVGEMALMREAERLQYERAIQMLQQQLALLQSVTKAEVVPLEQGPPAARK